LQKAEPLGNLCRDEMTQGHVIDQENEPDSLGRDLARSPHRHIVGDEAFGIDLEGEVAVITGDVPMGATREIAAEAIRLVLLVNDVSLRHLIPAEIAKGFGFLQSKPPTAFSPVAVTPDALGDAWDGGKLSGPLSVNINGSTFGRADAGVDMSFDFPDLIVHATRTRPLTAGTIVGSGTVSNRNEGDAPNPVAKGGVGYSCIAEVRMTEILTHGEAKTPFLTFGDRVRIDMLDRDGRSIFGAIDQTVKSVAEVA
ncbi:MAG: fumarylacetoacetate hydrolase family protein, partial [Pseudomonadota bacterium]